MKTYLFKYFFEGSWWHLEMKATSYEEAMSRVAVLSHRAKYAGELKAKIPARLGVFAKAWCWLANAWPRKEER